MRSLLMGQKELAVGSRSFSSHFKLKLNLGFERFNTIVLRDTFLADNTLKLAIISCMIRANGDFLP